MAVKTVKQAGAVKVEVEVTSTKKATPQELLENVLTLIDRVTAKPDAEAKWGKSIGLLGGGSVYINRSNADVRSTTKQVAEWARSIPGSTVRGPQGQYLRITF